MFLFVLSQLLTVRFDVSRERNIPEDLSEMIAKLDSQQ